MIKTLYSDIKNVFLFSLIIYGFLLSCATTNDYNSWKGGNASELIDVWGVPRKNRLQPEKMIDSEHNLATHRRYQEGVKVLKHQIEDSVVAYQWMEQLKSRQSEKRLAALRGLGKLGTDMALKALYMALGDEGEEVREEAKTELKIVRQKKELQEISERLEQNDSIVLNDTLELIRNKAGKKWERLLEGKISTFQFDRGVQNKAREVLI